MINDKLNGLYRSKYSNNYSDKDSEETRSGRNDPNFGYEYYAATQFEAIDARKAFPCFDEPGMKATFNVSIICDERLTALTNGDEIMVERLPLVTTLPQEATTMAPVVSDANGSTNVSSSTIVPSAVDTVIRKKRTTYERTPKMSTYLVAFVIGSFDHIKGRSKSGTLVRVFTPKGRSDEGTFALDVAIKSLDYFEEYFGIKYPMSKCDQVSINDFASGWFWFFIYFITPSSQPFLSLSLDFSLNITHTFFICRLIRFLFRFPSSGAMENWGIITYRESALLVNPETSLGQKQQIALTVAHE